MTNSAGDFQRKKKEKRRIKSESPASENKNNILALAPTLRTNWRWNYCCEDCHFQTYLPRYIHCMGPQYLHSVKFYLILHAKRVSFWTSTLTEVPSKISIFSSYQQDRHPSVTELVESIFSPGSWRKRHGVGFFNVFFLNCVSSIKAKRGSRPNTFAGKKPMKTFYILL